MRAFANVATADRAEEILREYLVTWDVREHYAEISLYSYLYKDNEVAEYRESEKVLKLL